MNFVSRANEFLRELFFGRFYAIDDGQRMLYRLPSDICHLNHSYANTSRTVSLEARQAGRKLATAEMRVTIPSHAMRPTHENSKFKVRRMKAMPT